MKLRFSLILGFLLAACASLQAQFIYSTNNGDITIVQYTNTAPDVVISNTIGGHPVVAIAANAITENTNVQSVIVGANVLSIGMGAISGDNRLATLVLGVGVTNIATDAFEFDTNLSTVTLECTNLQNIASTIFSHCFSLGSIAIPNSVTNIGTYAFDDCYDLTNVVLSDHLAVIQEVAFAGCPALAQITIPASVTNIQEIAFQNDSSLVAVYFLGNAPTMVWRRSPALMPTPASIICPSRWVGVRLTTTSPPWN